MTKHDDLMTSDDQIYNTMNDANLLSMILSDLFIRSRWFSHAGILVYNIMSDRAAAPRIYIFPHEPPDKANADDLGLPRPALDDSGWVTNPNTVSKLKPKR